MAKAGTIPVAELPKSQQDILATPAGFARWLGVKPYVEQDRAMNAVAPPRSKVSFCCGNEVGKTSLCVAVLILWHLTVFPRNDGNGGVISTAGAWRQITGQLVPAVKRFSHRFPGWDFNQAEIKIKGVPAYQGFSANNQWTAQGFHGSKESPLLAIIDEAGGVDEQIFFAIEDRCNPQRLLLTGSPAEPMGTFYNSRGKHSAFYKQHRLSQVDCLKQFGGHMEQAMVLRPIAKYDPDAIAKISQLQNVDWTKPDAINKIALTRQDWDAIRKCCRHPWVQSRVFADFGDAVEHALIGIRDYERCLENAPQWSRGDRHVFCDFAAGGDENVCAVRWGNKVWIEKAWREQNTMNACAEFVRIFNKLKNEIGLQPQEIEGDNDGLGNPMIDAIHEAGWPILEFHGGTKPIANRDYFNRVSEIWCEGADTIKRNQVILPLDDELKAQLITRKALQKFDADKKSKMAVETKKEMKARGLPSPDRADAVLGAMGPLPEVRSRNLITREDPHPDFPDVSEMHVDEAVLRGMDAGA